MLAFLLPTLWARDLELLREGSNPILPLTTQGPDRFESWWHELNSPAPPSWNSTGKHKKDQPRSPAWVCLQHPSHLTNEPQPKDRKSRGLLSSTSTRSSTATPWAGPNSWDAGYPLVYPQGSCQPNTPPISPGTHLSVKALEVDPVRLLCHPNTWKPQKSCPNQLWWCTPLNSALGWQRQADP